MSSKCYISGENSFSWYTRGDSGQGDDTSTWYEASSTGKSCTLHWFTNSFMRWFERPKTKTVWLYLFWEICGGTWWYWWRRKEAHQDLDVYRGMSYTSRLYGMPLLVAWNLCFLIYPYSIAQTNEMDSSSSVTLQICIVFIGIHSCILEKYSVFLA